MEEHPLDGDVMARLEAKSNWTDDEAGEWLGVPGRMVRRLRQERKLPYFKVGRYARLRPEDVIAYRDGQVRPARPELDRHRHVVRSRRS